MRKKDISRFEDYLSGNMTEEESEDFSRQLEENDELRQELVEFESVRELIRLEGLRQEILSIHSDKSSTPIKKSVAKRSYSILIAASLVLLISIISVITLDKRDSPSIDSLFEPYPDIITKRDTDPQELISWYNNKEYQKVLTSINIFDIKNDTMALYYINSLIASNNIESDISQLEKYTSTEYKYHQQIRWYLVLYYMQNENYFEAREIESMIRTGDYNSDKLIYLD